MQTLQSQEEGLEAPYLGCYDTFMFLALALVSLVTNPPSADRQEIRLGIRNAEMEILSVADDNSFKEQTISIKASQPTIIFSRKVDLSSGQRVQVTAPLSVFFPNNGSCSIEFLLGFKNTTANYKNLKSERIRFTGPSSDLQIPASIVFASEVPQGTYSLVLEANVEDTCKSYEASRPHPGISVLAKEIVIHAVSN